jgi:uncharacterized protein YecT (DUF1311 family)
MRRQQQNISFVAIIGILMSIAFFFSQQINNQAVGQDLMDTSLPKVETMEDIPDCLTEPDEAARVACYAQAATLSDQLVKAKVEAILALEADTGNWMSFIETQSSWEGSRNADCAFVAELAEDTDDAEIARNVCLLEHNLERNSLLKALICDYYDSSVCDAPDIP